MQGCVRDYSGVYRMVCGNPSDIGCSCSCKADSKFGDCECACDSGSSPSNPCGNKVWYQCDCDDYDCSDGK